MPSIDHSRREVLLKIVYYGCGLGGKTTNLEQIHARSRPEHRGKLLSLDAETERTLFFDLLPVDLGTFRGYAIRLHLCTVPGQARYERTRQLVLRGVDGVVFVVDSQADALDANLESLDSLGSNLRSLGLDPQRIPLIVQYNKRDLGDAAPISWLRSELGIEPGVPELEASAATGAGVFETLKAAVKECLRLIGDPGRAPQGRSPSILPGVRASMFPEALAGAGISVSRPDPELELTPVVPKAPRLPRFSLPGETYEVAEVTRRRLGSKS